LFRVFFGLKRTYCSFPATKEVIADYNKIKEFYSNHPKKNEIEKLVQNDFNDFILKWYTDINDNNIKVNDVRADIFFCAKIFIGISYFLSIIVFILSCIIKLKLT